MITVDFETKAIEGNPLITPPEPVGVAIRYPSGAKAYYTGEQMRAQLADIWGEDMLFHNAPFDLSVATRHLGLPWPAWHRVHDTKYQIFQHDPHAPSLGLKPSAERILKIPPNEQDEIKEWVLKYVQGARKSDWGAYISHAPEELVAKYAKQDVELTWRLFEKLYPKTEHGAYDVERELMPYLVRATRDGIRLDIDQLERDCETHIHNLSVVQDETCTRLNYEIEFTKNESIANALDHAGVVDGWVETKTGRRSTARENLLTTVNDPEVLALLQYEGALRKQLSSFMVPWRDMSMHGRLNPNWNQVRTSHGKDRGTRTGRLSSDGPNMQNVANPYRGPIPPGFGPIPHLRRYLLPEEGHIWVSRDFDAQEMRLLAHFERGALAAAFRDNPRLDPHQMIADLIKEETGVPITRKAAKAISFGVMYGMGATSVGKKIGIEVDEAYDLIQSYLAALPGVADLQRGTKYVGRCGDKIKTIGGRRYAAEPSRIMNGEWRDFSYKLLNYLIQGSAADQTKRALLRWFKRQPDNQQFLATVHDQIDISVLEGEDHSYLGECMEHAPELEIPMLTTLSVGPTWGDLKDV